MSEIAYPDSALGQAVHRLRAALGDTQQEFAQRLGLAISTVVRYERSRPPRGKALAQLERVASEHALDDVALTFRNALREELASGWAEERIETPANTVGFAGWPQTPEEDAMIFDVLAIMRDAQRDGGRYDGARAVYDRARKELKLLQNVTKRARSNRLHAIEIGQALEDRIAAVVRLSRLGKTVPEIAKILTVSRTFVEDVLAKKGEEGSV